MAKNWIRTTGLDQNEHVYYLPEKSRHVLTYSCPCGPRFVHTPRRSVLVHLVYTADAEGKDQKHEQ